MSKMILQDADADRDILIEPDMLDGCLELGGVTYVQFGGKEVRVKNTISNIQAQEKQIKERRSN